MHVISEKPLREFWSRHQDAKTPLSAWFKAMNRSTAQNLSQLKRAFGNVDYVPIRNHEFYVFDIGGNKYRLIAAIHFNTQKVFVRRVLTHAEYGTGRWKSNP